MYKIKSEILSADIRLKRMNDININLMIYKEFIDSISPSDWILRREKQYEARLKEIKKEWMSKKINDEPISDELSAISKSSSKKSNPVKVSSPSMKNKMSNSNLSIKHLASKEFEEQLSKDLM